MILRICYDSLYYTSLIRARQSLMRSLALLKNPSHSADIAGIICISYPTGYLANSLGYVVFLTQKPELGWAAYPK